MLHSIRKNFAIQLAVILFAFVPLYAQESTQQASKGPTSVYKVDYVFT